MVEIKLLTQTLFANGYLLDGARSIDGARLLSYSRRDRFGCLLRYLLAIPDHAISEGLATEVAKLASEANESPVLIGSGASSSVPSLTMEGFLARFGGPVGSLLPLEPSFPERLRVLGGNRLPSGVSGVPDKIFEEYARAGLQFLFGTRVIGYGKERSGEPVPDGLAIRTGSYVLYDAKAASGGYSVSRDELRKFSDYVVSFHRRYRDSYGPAYAFLVVSGAFADSDRQLSDRADQLFAATKTTRLCFIDADALIAGLEAVRGSPSLREGMDWDLLLSRSKLTAADIMAATKAAQRDRLNEDD